MKRKSLAKDHCWHSINGYMSQFPSERKNDYDARCCNCGAITQGRIETYNYDPNRGHGRHVSHELHQRTHMRSYGTPDEGACFGDGIEPMVATPLVPMLTPGKP